MGLLDWLRRSRRPALNGPSTVAIDAAFEHLDRAAEEQRAHNIERSGELRKIQHELEEDEMEALSILRRLERGSQP